jgi:hypothetical protein
MRHLVRNNSLALLFLVATTAAAQAPPCTRFEGTTLEDWTPVNATATIVSAEGRRFADVRDGPGPSNFVAPEAFQGNWLGFSDGCGSLCFDISVIDDGLPTRTGVRPYFVIEDGAGHSATFQMNPVVKGSGWHTVCAPVRPLVDGALPSNGEGTWSYGANTTSEHWSELLANVRTFRFAVDFAGSSAVSERLYFDNICFKPNACPEPRADATIVDQVEAFRIRDNWNDCPSHCTVIENHVGDTKVECNWGISPGTIAIGYVPGSGDGDKCTDPGAPLDIEPRHRLFVHGLHADQRTWDMWVDRVKPQMTYLGYKTVADNTGDTEEFGPGAAALITQVNELATQINDDLGDVPDASVWTYAHSLGALKIEALLQLGYEAGVACNFVDPCASALFRAARKIGHVYVFQGAHGGCLATGLNGDFPNHGLTHPGCPASHDIGAVNDSRFLPPFARKIPGTSTPWNMEWIVWSGREPQQKTITYVVATSTSANVCKGAKGFICNDDLLHDGVVYGHQMLPPYDRVDEAMAAGRVFVVNEQNYCHMSGDTWDPPRLSWTLLEKYIGMLPGKLKYLEALPPPRNRTVYTFTQDRVVCSQPCFCALSRAAACSVGVDCTQWEKPPFAPCANSKPAIGFPWNAIAQIASVASWKPCASEGGTCTFSGLRDVRYGADGTYALRSVENGTPCTSAVFGNPAPGVQKTCDVRSDPLPMTLPVPELRRRAVGH